MHMLREHQKVIDEVKSAQRTESRRLYASLEYKICTRRYLVRMCRAGLNLQKDWFAFNVRYVFASAILYKLQFKCHRQY